MRAIPQASSPSRRLRSSRRLPSQSAETLKEYSLPAPVISCNAIDCPSSTRERDVRQHLVILESLLQMLYLNIFLHAVLLLLNILRIIGILPLFTPLQIHSLHFPIADYDKYSQQGNQYYYHILHRRHPHDLSAFKYTDPHPGNRRHIVQRRREQIRRDPAG